MTISINAPIRAVGLAVLAALAVACGGGDGKPAAKAAKSAAAAGEASKKVAETPGKAADDGLANAVAVGKTAAAVDLKYDLPTRPAAGQPFEVELVFLPRIPADTLDVQATGMPGLIVAGGATAAFAPVAVGERYVAKAAAAGARAGPVLRRRDGEAHDRVADRCPHILRAGGHRCAAGGGEADARHEARAAARTVETTKASRRRRLSRRRSRGLRLEWRPLGPEEDRSRAMVRWFRQVAAGRFRYTPRPFAPGVPS